jgi:hypothetical protein
LEFISKYEKEFQKHGPEIVGWVSNFEEESLYKRKKVQKY